MRARNLVTSTTPAAGALLVARFAAIREQFDVPSRFPDAVEDAARAAGTRGPVPAPDVDLRHLPFVTLDPPGAKDLDQALCLERTARGFRLRYAIADVSAFVHPSDAIDVEARQRGVTIYCPDVRIPLHPTSLSEDGASLLPGVDRPAYVWDIALDVEGQPTSVDLRRAWVRTRERHDYATVQRQLDADAGAEWMKLLREVGLLRLAAEAARGGASLPVPEQEVVMHGDAWVTTLRANLPVEEWNAQLSLLTGMCAATMMLRAGTGILRTMPAPDDGALGRFRAQAVALGAPWSPTTPYGAFLHTLRSDDPRHLALLYDAAALFRGAGYVAFDGTPPQEATHAALGAPYAHVTAPLRRLVDRFGLAVCVSVAQDDTIPDWVRDALPELPATMARCDRRAAGVERACRDAVEAALLSSHVGQTLPAVVVDHTEKGAPIVQITDPAIVIRVTGSAAPGAAVTVRVAESDVTTGTASLEIVG